MRDAQDDGSLESCGEILRRQHRPDPERARLLFAGGFAGCGGRNPNISSNTTIGRGWLVPMSVRTHEPPAPGHDPDTTLPIAYFDSAQHERCGTE